MATRSIRSRRTERNAGGSADDAGAGVRRLEPPEFLCKLFECNRSDFVAAGGLMSYGPDLRDSYPIAVSYVDRILRGAKPSDLPVQFPTKFKLVINLKTAKAMGLTISESFLLRADQVIE